MTDAHQHNLRPRLGHAVFIACVFVATLPAGGTGLSQPTLAVAAWAAAVDAPGGAAVPPRQSATFGPSHYVESLVPDADDPNELHESYDLLGGFLVAGVGRLHGACCIRRGLSTHTSSCASVRPFFPRGPPACV